MIDTLCPHYQNTEKALATFNALPIETQTQACYLRCLIYAAKYIQICGVAPFAFCLIGCTASFGTFSLERYVFKNNNTQYIALAIIYLACLPLTYLSARFEDLLAYALINFVNREIEKIKTPLLSNV